MKKIHNSKFFQNLDFKRLKTTKKNEICIERCIKYLDFGHLFTT